MAFTVTDVPERERFEARDEEGTLGGVLTYQVTGGIVAYTHTEVEDRFRAQKLGSMLVRAAMDDARRRGRTVVPVCPFVSAWLDEHHEYDQIVARSTRKIR